MSMKNIQSSSFEKVAQIQPFQSSRGENWVPEPSSIEEGLGKERLDLLDEMSQISERIRKIEPEYLALKKRADEINSRMRELMNPYKGK